MLPHSHLIVLTIIYSTLVTPFLIAAPKQSTVSTQLTPANSSDQLEYVATFVETYCTECHDEWTEKGDRNFDPFLSDPYHKKHLLTIEEILDQINLGEMPPKKKKVLQPNDQEIQTAVQRLTEYLIQSEESSKPRTTILRRLTTEEYKNTITDLLNVDARTDDQTIEFPSELEHHGFKNIGEAQVLSDIQLQRIVKANRHYIEHAFPFPKNRPNTKTIIYKPREFNARTFETGGPKYRSAPKHNNFLDIGHGSALERFSNYVTALKNKGGIQEAGYYTITIDATAVNRKHPYPKEIYSSLDLEEPLQMALWLAPKPENLGEAATTGRIHLKTWDLTDHQRKSYSYTVWLPKGSIPSVSWMNGMPNATQAFSKLYEEHLKGKVYPPDFVRTKMRQNNQFVPSIKETKLPYLSEIYKGPMLRVFQMKLHGPIHKDWPSQLHKEIFGDVLQPNKVNLPKAVKNFATKAFRKPVKAEQVSHYVSAIRNNITNGMEPGAAIRLGFTGILSSPRFLYMHEGNSDKQKKLTPYELANRLSYTFWSSMPDQRLLSLAASGELEQPAVLTSEIKRLLNSPKAEAFHRNFTEAWLRIDKLGSMLPSRNQFPAYFRDHLESAMKKETQLFFADILQKNQPVHRLLDSNYTFVNSALARLYGWHHIKGTQFRKVVFPKDNPRPLGIIGHASVLTSSANGVETSPVTRGVWVLESLLGTPPAPAPPDVPPIEPDTRGATTIKERLEKHRTVAVCNDCHSKIDAWGFALEHYDPIGVYRHKYPIFKESRMLRNRGPNIDATGTLLDGTVINNTAGLTKELLKRKKNVTRNIIVKFLTYSTGRELNFADQAEVNHLTSLIHKKGLGLQDLIQHCIHSQAFLKR